MYISSLLTNLMPHKRIRGFLLLELLLSLQIFLLLSPYISRYLIIAFHSLSHTMNRIEWSDILNFDKNILEIDITNAIDILESNNELTVTTPEDIIVYSVASNRLKRVTNGTQTQYLTSDATTFSWNLTYENNMYLNITMQLNSLSTTYTLFTPNKAHNYL